MKTQRIEYIDTAKGLLITLVIIGHILIVLNPGYERLVLALGQSFISGFHMPAFFILHGILFNPEKWKRAALSDYIKSRTLTLLVPYVFFEILGIVVRHILYGQDWLTGFMNMVTVRCNVGADWFLPAMFMGAMLLLIHVKLSNPIIGWASAVCSLVLPMVFPKTQLGIVICRGLMGYGFIMIGYLGRKWFVRHKTCLMPTAIAMGITVLVAIVNLKWGGNDLYSATVTNPITLIVGGISGTILVLEFSKWLSNRVLAGVGQQSLIIMGTHQLIIYSITSLIPAVRGGHLMWGLAIFLIITLVEIPICWFLKRYFPFLVGK